MSKVLITGGLGAMGRYVEPELVESGHDVILLDVDRGQFDETPANVRFADITEFESLADVVGAERPDAVLHLAAKVANNDDQPLEAIQLNSLGTWNVLEASRLAGVQRVVAVSTRAVYGSFEGKHGGPSYEPTPEGYRTAPKGLYGSSKLAAEHVVASYRRRYDMDAIVTRQAWTFGPGKVGLHGVYGIYSSVVEAILEERHLTIDSGGDQPNDVVYNGDVGKALAALIVHPERFEHAVYNIGSGVPITLSEFATAAVEVLNVGGPVPDIGPGFGFKGFHRDGFGVLDVTRIRSATSWEPMTLEAALDDYAARFRSV